MYDNYLAKCENCTDPSKMFISPSLWGKPSQNRLHQELRAVDSSNCIHDVSQCVVGPSTLHIKKGSRDFCSYHVQFFLKNLKQFWPPGISSHELSTDAKEKTKKKWFNHICHRFKGKNYSHSKHAHVDYLTILNRAYLVQPYLTHESVKRLQRLTGLSRFGITVWFKWNRGKNGFISPLQILEEAFRKCQYPADENMQGLVKATGLSKLKVESWFRVSRALSNLFDEEKVDKEELILWRMFQRCTDGISDKEVSLMSYLLRMEKIHVYEIFLTWCQRHDVPNHMTQPSKNNIDAQTDRTFPDPCASDAVGDFSNTSATANQDTTPYVPLGVSCDITSIESEDRNSQIDGEISSPCTNIVNTAEGNFWESLIDQALQKKKSSVFKRRATTENDTRTCMRENRITLDENLMTVDNSETNQVGVGTRTTVTTDESQQNTEDAGDQYKTFLNEFQGRLTCVHAKAIRSGQIPSISVEELTNHDLVLNVLKKLRKKQRKLGIPCRARIRNFNIHKGQILTKKKRMQRKRLWKSKNRSYRPYVPHGGVRVVRPNRLVDVTRAVKLKDSRQAEIEELIQELQKYQQKVELRVANVKPFPATSSFSPATPCEEALFDMVQDTPTPKDENCEIIDLTLDDSESDSNDNEKNSAEESLSTDVRPVESQEKPLPSLLNLFPVHTEQS